MLVTVLTVPKSTKFSDPDAWCLSQSAELVKTGGLFQVHEISRTEYLTQTDYGSRLGRDLMDLISTMSFEGHDDRSYACSMTFRTTVLPRLFTYEPSLAFCMSVCCPLRTTVAQTVDTDVTRAGQKLATNAAVIDPLYERFDKSLDSQGTLHYTRDGRYRVVPTGTRHEPRNDPVQSFVFGGAMVCAHARVERMRAAVSAIQRMHSLASCALPRLDPYRRFLPSTSIVVVPKETFTDWVAYIRSVWVGCRLREIRDLRDLTEYRDPETRHDVDTYLRGLDLVVVSRTLWFHQQTPRKETVLLDNALDVFRSVQFRCAVVDDAQAYLVTEYNRISRSAIILRTHAFAHETLLLTDTAGTAELGSWMQYLFLLGVSHSRLGQLTELPLSQHELRQRRFWASDSRHVPDTDLRCPATLQMHQGTRKYRWMVDHLMVARAVHAFTQNMVVNLG
jgi:hypothetical protein